MLLQQFINGLNMGSIYALIALGYTMVYGIAKMLNFAHGDVIMVGGYVVMLSLPIFGANPVLAASISTTAISPWMWVPIWKPGRKPTAHP